jgi:hypothetical protein
LSFAYDADFWPDQSTAAEAVELAERVRSIITAVLPPEAG